MTAPVCPDCKTPGRLTSGREVFPRRRDLAHKGFWVCDACDARVGCHPGTSNPLGGLANKALREARMAAHDAFDPLWRSGRMTRSEAYAWLAQHVGVTPDQAHIGMFDILKCWNVVEGVRQFYRALVQNP